jgi:hypothetical protein
MEKNLLWLESFPKKAMLGLVEFFLESKNIIP